MHIISHRGKFSTNAPGNSKSEIFSALGKGFSIETDIRDSEEVVVRHDPFESYDLTFSELICEVKNNWKSTGFPVAINIKSDGLAPIISKLLDEESKKMFFFFDMSIPDMYIYWNLDLPVYCRVSEIEKPESYAHKCKGIWFDCFQFDFEGYFLRFEKSLKLNLPIVIVSPELHGILPPDRYWEKFKAILSHKEKPDVALCTDLPKEADRYFNYD